MCARLTAEGMGRYADQIAGHRCQAGVPGRGQCLKAHNGQEDLGMCLASGFKLGIGNRLRQIWKQHLRMGHRCRRAYLPATKVIQLCPDRSSCFSGGGNKGCCRPRDHSPLRPARNMRDHNFCVPGLYCLVILFGVQAFYFQATTTEAIHQVVRVHAINLTLPLSGKKQHIVSVPFPKLT